MRTSKRIKGLYIALIGVFIFSPDSLLIRLLNFNDLSLIFAIDILFLVFQFLYPIYNFFHHLSDK